MIYMKLPDVDRIRSERSLSFGQFLTHYNEGLPSGFPLASLALLREFKKSHASLFKTNLWSLNLHRKKVMDWLTTKTAQEARAISSMSVLP